MLKNKKLLFVYLLIILLTSGCLNFKNNNNNQLSTESQNTNDYESSWLDKSPNSNTNSNNKANNTSSSDNLENDLPVIIDDNDIIVNGRPQPKPTEEARELELKEQAEFDKVSDIAIKYISSSKEYLRLSQSLPRVSGIMPEYCEGCFIANVEYDILDTENPGSAFLIQFVNLEIANWQVVAPLDI
ncbi:MAG: hypothetical protein Q8O32_03625 [bacterium]|nr:hypothetical protein [bacterium]